MKRRREEMRGPESNCFQVRSQGAFQRRRCRCRRRRRVDGRENKQEIMLMRYILTLAT